MCISKNYQSRPVPQTRLLPGIHGLRGIAALMVVLFHVVHLANIETPKIFIFIARDFGNGVFLFFILSAFCLMHSTGHTVSRSDWIKEYFVKRFWRIAPLFYFVLAIMVLWPIFRHHQFDTDLPTLLLNISFSFGFVPWKGLVRAGWTVGVEMLFYVIFPILLITIKTYRSALILLVASCVGSYAIHFTLHSFYQPMVHQYGYNWAYFSFGSNLCYFAMGICAFWFVREVNAGAIKLSSSSVAVFAIAVLVVLVFTEIEKPLRGPGRLDLMLWGMGFVALCAWQTISPSRWTTNGLCTYLGERSYSIYLLHPLMIRLLKDPLQDIYQLLNLYIGSYAYFICVCILLIPLLILSEVTYRIIEIPGINFGKRINQSGNSLDHDKSKMHKVNHV